MTKPILHHCDRCNCEFRGGRPSKSDGSYYCSDTCRFWAKVDASGGQDSCWPWTCGVFKKRGGYGSFGVGGRTLKAHRVAWELTNGKPPDGLHVLHRCDNPPCCNPAHLFLGTDLDNCHDKIAKGRQNLSVESYQRRADSLRGKPRSAEARANMSAALKGKKQKPEHVAKRNASNRGLKRSAETRRRLSEARSRWWAAKREALAGQARHLVEYPR